MSFKACLKSYLCNSCFLILLVPIILGSCSKHYLQIENIYTQPAQNSECCLLIFVDARHLNYTDGASFMLSLQKQPSNVYGRFGHAWIYLKGVEEDGSAYYIEGGHSGETGLSNPQYFDGVMDLVDAGDPNPIRYLWETQTDGYFEQGSGRHIPNYAVKLEISQDQYYAIKDFICLQNYTDYAITGNQCSSFVAQVAAIAGVRLDYEVALKIPSKYCFGGRKMCLWSDPKYSELIFGTPDALYYSLKELVEKGHAECILSR